MFEFHIFCTVSVSFIKVLVLACNIKHADAVAWHVLSYSNIRFCISSGISCWVHRPIYTMALPFGIIFDYHDSSAHFKPIFEPYW